MSPDSNLPSQTNINRDTISSETLIFHGNFLDSRNMDKLDEHNNTNTSNSEINHDSNCRSNNNICCVNVNLEHSSNNKSKSDIFSRNNSTTTTQNSPSRDYMTLTPVKLKVFESPLKNNLFTQLEQEPLSSPTKFISSPIGKLYKDKFNSISRDLENLLENLNSVYQKIGYSKNEIKNNEKQIFNNLSQSIEKYYTMAEEKMNRLSIDNDIEQEILNTMLEKLHDPNGLNTISDVYIRNAILLPKSKTVPDSPKKPLSLLEVQKSLKKAKNFVYVKYIPELTNFINCNITLQTLINCVGNIVNNFDDNDQNILKELPNLEISKQCEQILKSVSLNDLDEFSQILKKNKKFLLSNEQFNDIGQKRLEQINKITKTYKQEYNLRYNNAKRLVDQCNSVLKELHLNVEQDCDEQFNALLQNYNIIQTKQFVKVSDDILNQLNEHYTEYNFIKEERLKIKKDLLDNCQKLWTMLKIPQAEINTFIRANDNLSLKSLDNLKKKLQELNEMKKKLIKILIDSAWKRIHEQWQILQTDDEDKNVFIEKFNQLKISSATLKDDEKLLEICEGEIKELDTKLSIYAPVLKLIQEFKSLQQDKLFLEQSSKDSSRLLSRNSHKILLKEEKARKRITRHFPRVIYNLKNKLEDAKDMFKKPFTINGENIYDIISEQEMEFKNKFPRSVLSISNRSSNNTNSRNDRYRVQKPRTPNAKPINLSKNHIQENKDKFNTSSDINNINKNKNNLKHKNEFQQKTPNSKATNSATRNAAERNITSSSTIKRLNESLTKRMTRSIKGSKSVSPKRIQTKLLPPTSIKKRTLQLNTGITLGERPTLERSQTTNIPINTTHIYQSNIPLHGIRPTRLFPISHNKLNVMNHNAHDGQHKSKLPTLSKKNPIFTSFDTIQQKENFDLQAVRKTPLVMRITSNESHENAPLSSPYRESKYSVYQLSMSPAGKFQLNVQQEPVKNVEESNNNNNKHNNNTTNNVTDWDTNFDDTSILEDDEMDTKFMQWKEEQLIKLDNLKQNQSRQRDIQLNQK